MRFWLLRFRALALLAAVLVLLIITSHPALAQAVTTADTSTNIVAVVLAAVLAALPSLVLSGWSLFKSYAAKSAAMWDDEAVAFVEKIAAGVVKASNPATAATPTTTAPITGVDH